MEWYIMLNISSVTNSPYVYVCILLHLLKIKEQKHKKYS